MRVTERMMVDNLRQNINYNSESLAHLQDQLASGKRIRKPSDDPQSVRRALSLKARSDEYTQYMRNISSARDWIEATDTALMQVSNVLKRARDVALRGSTDTLGDDGRKALGQQVQNFLQEALQAVNLTHDGKYVFAGFKVGLGTLPFEEVAGTITYNGDSGVIQRQITPGVRMGINIAGNVTIDGDPILLDGLQTMVDIRDQLLSGGKVSLTDIDRLTDALNGMPAIMSTVGARMQRVNVTEDAVRTLQANVTVVLSREQDTDVAEVMTKLMMQENVYRAALAIGARVIQASLLDFLS